MHKTSVDIDWSEADKISTLYIVKLEALPSGPVRYTYSDGTTLDYNVPGDAKAWMTQCVEWSESRGAKATWHRRGEALSRFVRWLFRRTAEEY